MKTENEPINKHLRYQSDYLLKNILRNAISLCNMLPETLVKSCLNCDLFNEETETCKKWNSRPPARVIAFGCGDWENVDDTIPF